MQVRPGLCDGIGAAFHELNKRLQLQHPVVINLCLSQRPLDLEGAEPRSHAEYAYHMYISICMYI